ncbi:hypothetical protein SY83_13110 [Paenibacillus swuensis]|uniref:Transport permease protein n=2 Tax=Paenibacillus swuensis TaxID=1178515 RepID=A0A172TP97_9BACL|nr:hypothetical protein SY83_13110 [Paenibacillus swuensis]
MLFSQTSSELRSRYRGSVFGMLWTFMIPLLMLGVYTLIFSTIMRMDVENYSVFLFVGLLPWLNFSATVNTSTGIYIRNSNIIKKIYFPREVLPLANVLTGNINYLYGMVILIAALYISGIGLSVYALYFPLILIIQSILTFAIVLILSSLTVYFRDIEHITNILTMLWFYFTPIIYPSTLIPQKYKQIFELNPVAPIVKAYQDIFYYQKSPDFASLAICACIFTLLLFFAYYLHHKLNRRMAEMI